MVDKQPILKRYNKVTVENNKYSPQDVQDLIDEHAVLLRSYHAMIDHAAMLVAQLAHPTAIRQLTNHLEARTERGEAQEDQLEILREVRILRGGGQS
jgi:hypothetical protein